MEVGLPYKKAAAEPYTIIFDCVWLFFFAPFFRKHGSQVTILNTEIWDYNDFNTKNPLEKTLKNQDFVS